MRLTLRTMLAYVDDLLEPEDAEEIRKKIDESEFASNLLHRIRDVMRRLRLGTPDGSDRAPRLDPNTVAEYLDNSLAPDRVLDFEKICLESDVHLAEVACCHEILALVLGEPAEVEPASRQRMYQLANLAESKEPPKTDEGAVEKTPAEPPRAAVAAPAPVEPPPVESRRPEADRHKAARPFSWWPTATAVTVTVVVVILLLAITGQLESGSVLGKLLAFRWLRQPAAEAPEVPTVAPQVPGVGPSVPEPAEEPIASKEEAEPAAEAGASGGEVPGEPPGETPEAAQGGPSGEPSGAAGAGDAMSDTAEPGGSVPKEPVEPPPTIEPAPTEPGASPTAPAVAPDVEPGRETTMPRPEGSTVPPLDQPPVAKTPETEGTEKAAAEKPQPAAGEEGPAPAAPLPSQVVGELDAPMQVLLAFDADSGTWHRLPSETKVTVQTRYLSPPTFRPMLRLDDGTQIRLVGGTQLELLPPDEAGTAGVAVAFGRLVVDGPEKPGGRLRLVMGERSGVITFATPEARLAVEVFRIPTSGADPETQPGPLMALLFTESGSVSWQEGGQGEPVSLEAPSQVTVNDQAPAPEAVEEFPEWIAADTMSLLDQRASNTVESEWALDKHAAWTLRELAVSPLGQRRREVRFLALRCLDYVGDFELLVAALDEPEERMLWPDYVEQLRAAVQRSPQAAAQVRTAMEDLHGVEGATLYEMLWKYDDDTLEAEEAARLVRALDHDTLAFRVVAIQTLRRTTKLTINYRPEEPAAKRRPWIAKWEKRLLSSKPAPGSEGAAEGTSTGVEAPAVEPPFDF